jgi:hypothetical protein
MSDNLIGHQLHCLDSQIWHFYDGPVLFWEEVHGLCYIFSYIPSRHPNVAEYFVSKVHRDIITAVDTGKLSVFGAMACGEMKKVWCNEFWVIDIVEDIDYECADSEALFSSPGVGVTFNDKKLPDSIYIPRSC